MLCAFVALAQSDRGGITGTVTDSTGAVLAGATLEAKSAQTGAVYPGGTTATGNYNISQLPIGTYTLTITAQGFKSFIRPNIEVPVATTVRVDATMEVGGAAESITVTDAAPLLQTESGEMSQNVSTSRPEQSARARHRWWLAPELRVFAIRILSSC
ncbi:MAG: carboxypeptidase-like regulatory domain-containing protein [Acidobacteriota bacterium]